MAADATPQSYLYYQRGTNGNVPQQALNNTQQQSQQYTNTGNPYGYYQPQFQQQQGYGNMSSNMMPYFNQGGYYGSSGYGSVPQNYGQVGQPQSYSQAQTPQVDNRYIPPMYNTSSGQWNNMQSYNLPSGYGPYSNNGYQIPYFNQQQGAQNGNPYAQSPYGGQYGYGGSMGGYGQSPYGGYGGGYAGMSPAYQMQQQMPYMPQFNYSYGQQNSQQQQQPAAGMTQPNSVSNQNTITGNAANYPGAQVQQYGAPGFGLDQFTAPTGNAQAYTLPATTAGTTNPVLPNGAAGLGSGSSGPVSQAFNGGMNSTMPLPYGPTGYLF